MKKTVQVGTRSKRTYHVFVPEGSYDLAENRRKLIMDIVEQYPGIRHTHIIGLCSQIAKIPKITVEHILEILKDENLLDDVKNTTSPNGLRTWHIKKSEYPKEGILDTIQFFQQLKKEVTTLGKMDSKNFVFRESLKIVHLIKLLSNCLPLFRIASIKLEDPHLQKQVTNIENILNKLCENVANNNGNTNYYVRTIITKELKTMLKDFEEFSTLDKTIRKNTKFGYTKSKVGRKIQTTPVKLEDYSLADLKTTV